MAERALIVEELTRTRTEIAGILCSASPELPAGTGVSHEQRTPATARGAARGPDCGGHYPVAVHWRSTSWSEPSSKSLASGRLISSDVADGSSRVARTARRIA